MATPAGKRSLKFSHLVLSGSFILSDNQIIIIVFHAMPRPASHVFFIPPNRRNRQSIEVSDLRRLTWPRPLKYAPCGQ